MTKRADLIFLAVATAILLLPSLVHAAENAPIDPSRTSEEALGIRDVQIGFDGKYKLGYWTPLRVTLEAHEAVAGRLEATVRDGDGVRTTVSTDRERPMQLASGETLSETLYIKPGQVDGPLEIRFADDSGRAWEWKYFPGDGGRADEVPRGLPATVRLLVVVGGDVGLADALRVGEEDPAIATHTSAIASANELPDDSLGWDGVDGVVLFTSDAALYRDRAFVACAAALEEWLNLGGRLHLFVGQNGDELLAVDGPLAAFVPGDYDQMQPLRQMSEIERLCDSRYPLNTPPGQFRLMVPYVSPVEGRIVAEGGNLPLVIRDARGFGELTWVGLDVDQPPLADWSGRPELLRRLFGATKEATSDAASDAGRLTSLGYTDLVGQLRAALDTFVGVRTVPFAWVIGCTLVYLALLGPVDYLLVHRWGRRPVLTWLTLPLFVLAIGGGAYGIARATKGDALRLNQVEVVDVDLASGLLRGTLWANLYTPQHDSFTLELEPQFASGSGVELEDVEAVLSWLALPGRGLGGVEATADASSMDRDYRYDDGRSQLDGLPLAIWSSKALQGTWSARAAVPLDASLTATADEGITGRQGLAGRLTNRMSFELRNMRLYFQGRIFRLDTLQPGQSVDLDGKLWVTAANELTGRTLSKDAPPYDAAARDARRVLQMIMWYNFAGGANYVGLVNRYHGRLEFGHLLDAGRAVLVAESAQPASRIENNGAPVTDDQGLHLVVYRIVIPVESN